MVTEVAMLTVAAAVTLAATVVVVAAAAVAAAAVAAAAVAAAVAAPALRPRPRAPARVHYHVWRASPRAVRRPVAAPYALHSRRRCASASRRAERKTRFARVQKTTSARLQRVRACGNRCGAGSPIDAPSEGRARCLYCRSRARRRAVTCSARRAPGGAQRTPSRTYGQATTDKFCWRATEFYNYAAFLSNERLCLV